MHRSYFTYQRGDRVVVVPGLSRSKHYLMDPDPDGELAYDDEDDEEWWRPSDAMVELAGSVVTIADCVDGGDDNTSHYTIEELPGGEEAWANGHATYSCWTDAMFFGYEDSAASLTAEVKEDDLLNLLSSEG